ncbi:hypothetical protein LINPERHAP2_LOCUS10771 [Linum perenne]
MLQAANRGEGAGNTDDDDLLAGGEGVDGDLLELIVLVEVSEGSVRQGSTGSDGSH